MPNPAIPVIAEADQSKPLASYVLRVCGRPASLRFELLDLRTGERHLFCRTESVLEFLQQAGLPGGTPNPKTEFLADEAGPTGD
jgi:hypothetical protein